MWKFFDRILRRLTSPAAHPSTQRKSAPRRRSLLLEALEARWVPSGSYSISQNFNPTAVAAGDTLWFSSVAGGIGGVPNNTTAIITVTNQTISFTDSLAGTVNLSLPNAVLTLNPSATTATTTFNTSLSEWVTQEPSPAPGGNLFLSAGALALPSGLHGSDNPVTWSATFTTSVSGLQFNWAWGAAAYTGDTTNYNSIYGSLSVKPCDNNSASSYLNNDLAGTPESYKSILVAGATGTGGTNYTGTLSSNTTVQPTYSASTYVSLAGVVYNDVNGTGTYGTGDTGISGVILTLSGTTTGGSSVSATTTTAANGAYSFVTDSTGLPLSAGTYQITETQPSAYHTATNNVGTVNGASDGTVSGDTISAINLSAGQNGINYNFGNNAYTIDTQNFTNTALAVGDTLWFVSVVSNVSGVGTTPVSITLTNQTITFTDSFGGTFNLSVPNAVLTLNPGGLTATTTFNSSLNEWVSSDPSNLGGNLFLSAYALAAAQRSARRRLGDLAGQVRFHCIRLAIPLGMGRRRLHQLQHDLQQPERQAVRQQHGKQLLQHRSGRLPGEHLPGQLQDQSDQRRARGNGSPNYTGNPNANVTVTPIYTPTYVSLAGIVYNDANNNGIFDTGDTGISGVTLNLTGTTTGGASVTATTTTASGGTYSFTTDSNGNPLIAGTYQITETEPVGYYKGSDTVGSVNGSTDGVENKVDVMSSITLAVGQNGTGYNFGEVDPFSVGSVPYPYSSTNALTNVAFNESEIMYGASVNLAASTFDIFYSDEHALCLGVNQVTVQVNGTTTNGSTTVTVATSGLTVGATVSGTGIPSGTTIASVGQTTITLSTAATANGTTTLTFTNSYSTAQMPTGSSTASAVNPGVGDTNVTGAAGAVDASGRPLFPSLYVTDITNSPSSLSGDWQSGGTAVSPSAIYGSWKSYALSVNETVSPATVTQTGGNDPTTANGWTLPVGADPVPASISGSNAGYGTELQWSLSSLYGQGILIPGHNYRFYFVVHDGDQNNSGGDVGTGSSLRLYLPRPCHDCRQRLQRRVRQRRRRRRRQRHRRRHLDPVGNHQQRPVGHRYHHLRFQRQLHLHQGQQRQPAPGRHVQGHRDPAVGLLARYRHGRVDQLELGLLDRPGQYQHQRARLRA